MFIFIAVFLFLLADSENDRTIKVGLVHVWNSLKVVKILRLKSTVIFIPYII